MEFDCRGAENLAGTGRGLLRSFVRLRISSRSARAGCGSRRGGVERNQPRAPLTTATVIEHLVACQCQKLVAGRDAQVTTRLDPRLPSGDPN